MSKKNRKQYYAEARRISFKQYRRNLIRDYYRRRGSSRKGYFDVSKWTKGSLSVLSETSVLQAMLKKDYK